jgi:23S rRNA (adenine2503-C2)-methyltransferase
MTPSDIEKIKTFVDILTKNGINATVRRTLGQDIDAACGQLRQKNQQKN